MQNFLGLFIIQSENHSPQTFIFLWALFSANGPRVLRDLFSNFLLLIMLTFYHIILSSIYKLWFVRKMLPFSLRSTSIKKMKLLGGWEVEHFVQGYMYFMFLLMYFSLLKVPLFEICLDLDFMVLLLSMN